MKILFIGESWIVHMIHTKGYDSFTSTKYEEGATYLLSCLREQDIDMAYICRRTRCRFAFPNRWKSSRLMMPSCSAM